MTILGITLGALFVIALVIVLVWCYCKGRGRSSRDPAQNHDQVPCESPRKNDEEAKTVEDFKAIKAAGAEDHEEIALDFEDNNN